MHTSLKPEHALLVEQIKLEQLRQEVSKGAIQAERGEFSKHTVDTLLKELNNRELNNQLANSPRPIFSALKVKRPRFYDRSPRGLIY